MPSLNHAALSQLIAAQDWWFAASELHGILSALAAFKHRQAATALLAESSADNLSQELLQHCEAALADESLSYQLLLAEETELAQRAESFVDWCQGFLLAVQFLSQEQQLRIEDEQISQFIAELGEFSQLDTAIDNSEDNALALVNLEEHCRLGVMMIYAHYSALASKKAQ